MHGDSSYLYPCDGGTIKVEKIRYEHGKGCFFYVFLRIFSSIRQKIKCAKFKGVKVRCRYATSDNATKIYIVVVQVNVEGFFSRFP